MNKDIYTVLRTGGIYTIDHVNWLKQQCNNHAPGVKFKCLTNYIGNLPEGIERIPLINNWKSWWSKIELFRFDNVFYIDLDTVLLGNIVDIIENTNDGFYALKNFRRDKKKETDKLMGSGIMTWNNKPYYVYEQFDISVINKYGPNVRPPNKIGDQGYLNDTIESFIPLQKAFPDRVCSYKYDAKSSSRPSADIVCFHGRPRPWDCNQPWVPNLSLSKTDTR